jgi:hypothetical protein
LNSCFAASSNSWMEIGPISANRWALASSHKLHH